MNPQITADRLAAAYIDQITDLSTRLALAKAEAATYRTTLQELYDKAMQTRQSEPEPEPGPEAEADTEPEPGTGPESRDE